MKLSDFIIKPLIIGYRYLISPILGMPCRFQPTCSCYALEAYEKHGIFRATWLTFWRVCRCNPWGGQGYDPVPEATPEAKKKQKH